MDLLLRIHNRYCLEQIIVDMMLSKIFISFNKYLVRLMKYTKSIQYTCSKKIIQAFEFSFRKFEKKV